MDAPAPPPSLAEVGRAAVERIDGLLSSESDRWAQVSPLLQEPLDFLRRLVVAGGKRLRPAFCHWAYVGAGGDAGDPRLIDAEAALELLHTFALVHDDIMDGSDTRRREMTVHAAFTATHHLQGWRGESRRFGEGVAILVGDLAFVYADILLGRADSDVLRIFSELRLEVNVGQYLDLAGTARASADEAESRLICRYKSGLYTVERPLHLGAALAGRADLASALSSYGAPLGEAFQLRDDLLGAFGDSNATGKPVGEDLREGKPTVLHAVAVERAEGRDSIVLADRYGATDLNPEDVAEIRAVFERTGARQYVADLVASLTDESLSALARIDLIPAAKAELTALAMYVSARDR